MNFKGREEELSDKNESQKMAQKGQKFMQAMMPNAKPNIHKSEKLNQKVIDDNFNYQTEQSEVVS